MFRYGAKLYHRSEVNFSINKKNFALLLYSYHWDPSSEYSANIQLGLKPL